MREQRISASLLICLALGLLVLPMQWVFAAVLAAVFHEYCHYLAIRLCGGQTAGLNAGLLGARLEVRGLSTPQELVCALTGPLGSLSLLLAARWLPRTAICAGLQGLYNLLPVYPLDGGRVVRCFAELCLPPLVAVKLCAALEWVCLIGLLLLGIYGSFVLNLGLLPVLGSISLGVRAFRGKIPCKPWGNSVQ